MFARLTLQEQATLAHKVCGYPWFIVNLKTGDSLVSYVKQETFDNIFYSGKWPDIVWAPNLGGDSANRLQALAILKFVADSKLQWCVKADLVTSALRSGDVTECSHVVLKLDK